MRLFHKALENNSHWLSTAIRVVALSSCFLWGSMEGALAQALPNPDFSANSCLNTTIFLVIDASGSVNTTERGFQRQAALDYLQAVRANLGDNQAKVAIVYFASDAEVALGTYTNVNATNLAPGGSIYTALTTATQPLTTTGGLIGDLTDWEAALTQANTVVGNNGGDYPELMLFFTDGQPTEGEGSDEITPANTFKQEGTHIHFIGIGNQINLTPPATDDDGRPSRTAEVIVGAGFQTFNGSNAVSSDVLDLSAGGYDTNLVAALANFGDNSCQAVRSGINGTVFQDNDESNTQNGTEPSLPNITARLYADKNGDGALSVADDSNSDNVLNATDALATQVTDTSGNYSFIDLLNGKYLVQVDEADSDLPTPSSIGTPNPIPVTIFNADVVDQDFGFDPKVAVTLTGHIFEDINYGGGIGRNYTEADISSSLPIGVGSATIEIWNTTGTTLLGTTVSQSDGTYTFNAGNVTGGLSSGTTYRIRVVNSTVDSNRPSNATGKTLLAVQTFRTESPTGNGSLTEVTHEVGGRSPADTDVAAGTFDSNLRDGNATQTWSTVQMPATGGLAGLDFGFNFSTIVNTNDSGQGSLRQFIINSNELDNAGLSQDLPIGVTAPANSLGTPVNLNSYETSIFMIPDASDSRITLGSGLGQINLTAPPEGGSGLAYVVNLTTFVADPSIEDSTLPQITDAFTSIDGLTQTVNIGNTNTPNTTINSESTGSEIVLNIASNINADFNHVLALQVSNNIVRSLSLVVETIAASKNIFGITLNVGTQPSNQGFAPTSNQIIEDVTVAGFFQNGVMFSETSDSVLRDSVLRDNGFEPIEQYDNVHLRRGSSRNLIENNIILRSGHFGIDLLSTARNNNNIIRSNFISGNGLKDNNQGSGIAIRLGDNNLVESNTIFGNVEAGIEIESGNTGNKLTRNNIYNNGSDAFSTRRSNLGIDLSFDTFNPDGVTLNDSGDADLGGNERINFPIIAQAVDTGANIVITGTNAAAGPVTVEVFSNAVCNADISGVTQTDQYGEGQKYEASSTSTVAAAGTFSITVPKASIAGNFFTATATDAAGNTSEFSTCVEAVASNPDLTLVKRITRVNTTNSSGFINDPATEADNHPNWPASYLRGDIQRNDIRVGDELEYTIYFLSSGNAPITNVSICDLIPAGTTFLPNTYGTGRGMQLALNGFISLSNVTDEDRGIYLDAGNTPAVPCPAGTNTNGAVVVNVAAIPGALPNAIGPGDPSTSYGYIRFRVKVN